METVELSYDVFETGDTRTDLSPIVLMHGLFWNKFMYRDLARDLCQETKRKIFCLDLRNHGDSPFREDCGTLVMVKDVKRFLDKRALKRVIFVSHSFSCSIAYIIALERPDTVEKMVMIDNPPFNDFSEHFTRESVQPQVDIQNRMLGTLQHTLTLKEAKTKFYNLATLGTKGQEYFYKKAAYDLTKENGVFKWKIDLDFMMGKYRRRLFSPESRGSSNHDILIIRCPNSGRVYDAKFEAVLKYNPRAKLVTLEDTTHLLMFEKMPEFIEIVKDYLYEPEPASTS